jgi:protein O-GlcNAc transferase
MRRSRAITKRHSALDPGYALAHNDLGGILLRKGENAAALVHFQRALELEPEFVEAHYNAGGVLFGMGRLEDALSQYEIVASLNPRLKPAHFMLGKVAEAFARSGNASQAASIAQRALRLAQAAGETDLEPRFAAELQSYQRAAQKK